MPPNITYGLLSEAKPKRSDKILPGEDVLAKIPGLLSTMADWAPIIGGAKGAYEEMKAGNPGWAAVNAATVPLDLIGGVGTAAKIGMLGMVKRGKDYDKIPKMLAEIDDGYKKTGEIKKLKKIEAAVLDSDEVAAFNSKRHASQPKLADGSLEYNGRHHYKSRADTPEGNGYTIDDMGSQLDSVTKGKLVPQVDRAGVAMKQTAKRDDGYGNNLTDKMSIMVSPDGKGELYSVIPDDGLRKGQKVQRGLLDSGDQAHPISDGVRTDASEPFTNNIAPKRELTQYEQRHLVAQRNAALPVELGGLGLPPDNTAMDRARAMGGIPVYTGTKSDVVKVDLSKAGATDPGLVGKAFYSTPSGDQASGFAMSQHYGNGDSPNVMPLMLIPNKTAISQDGVLLGKSLSEIHPNGITKQSASKINKEISKSGYDTVQFNLGDEAMQYASLDPSTVRSRFAAFDPMRRHEADLLGYADPSLLGVIGGGGLLGLGGYAAYNRE